MRRPALLPALVPLALVAAGCGVLDDGGSGDLPQGPITVEAGQAFSLNGFDFEGGWAPEDDGEGRTVFEVRGTNTGNDETRGVVMGLTFSFYAGGELLDEVGCSDERGAAADGVTEGDDLTLVCDSFTEADLSAADEIRVAVS